MPQYASVPQYMPQYMPQYASVPQYMPQYMPQYVSVPQYVVSMPSVAPQAEPRNPVVPGASLEVKPPDKGNTEKGSEAKTEPAEKAESKVEAEEKPKAESKVEAEEKPKAESKVEAEEKPKEEPKEEPKAESKVETKDEDNKNIDLSEIMKELSSDTDTIKKYYKNEV